jgi:hypothetical protein
MGANLMKTLDSKLAPLKMREPVKDQPRFKIGFPKGLGSQLKEKPRIKIGTPKGDDGA